MTVNLSIRNLDDGLVSRLKRRAARHGRSAEAEVREILRQTVAEEDEPDFESLAAEIRALTAGRHHTPAEVLMRESRDER
ncbi:MAG: plasmid stabilization protein [Acetobacteraceae bacterium]